MAALPEISIEQRRQLLVDRQLLGADGRSRRDVDGVVAALGLLHSTDPATPYLSIHARSDVSISDVDAAIYDEPARLLRHTTIRRTVFVMPSDVVPLAHGAYNPPLVGRLRSQLLKWLEAGDSLTESAEKFLAQTERSVVQRLQADGPTTGADLAIRVPALRVSVDPAPGAAYSKPIRITSKVLEILAAEGRIVRARPSGNDFTSGAWRWTVPDRHWPHGFGALDQASALTGLLDRYLAAFGPATVTDIAWWSGLTKTAVKQALASGAATEVRLDGGEAGWMRAADAQALTVSSERSPVVALLPGLDSSTMGWKLRSWYVDDSEQAGLFDRNGNAGPTVWVDGVVVGAWTQRADGRVVTEVLADVGSEASDQITSEAARIERWLGDVRVKWRYPTPITKRLSGA